MSSLTPLGTRQYQNSGLTGSTQQPARGNNAVQQSAASKASANVALSPGAVDLQQRIETLGNNTIDLAQNFLGSFAQKMLGDGAKGATIAFDSVALETSSSMATGRMRSEGADGVMNAAAFSLNESSHFLGKGTITLEDGTKYDFEVEVQYEASMSAGYASPEQAERKKQVEQNPAMPLPAIEFPDIDWPGSLGDLFRLMDKQISGDVKDADKGDVLGKLSVRLMNLVTSTQSLDTYAPPLPTKAYLAETSTEPGPRAPTVVQDAILAKKAAREADEATDKLPMPIKVPVQSSTDVPTTISTTPPADDAA